MLRPSNPSRRGFTLVELLLSMSVATVLMAGLASAMVLASHAIPDPQSPMSATVTGYQIAEEIASELYTARTFTGRSATAVEFTVADRDNDGTPETIRYAWSGSPGDPLTRQYNGGTIVNVAENLHEFNLDYGLGTVTRGGPPGNSESNETVLESWDGTVNLLSRSVHFGAWPGECFQPSLPAEAISWKVTQVKFKAAQNGNATGTTMVQLRPADAGQRPTNVILEQHPLDESTLPVEGNFLWQEVIFSSVSDLSPDQGLCLVLTTTDGEASCMVEYQNSAVTLPDAAFVESGDGGSSWTVRAAKALNFSVRGTITTVGAPTIIATYHVAGVHIELRLGPDSPSAVATSVPILNRPEVTLP